MKKSSIIFIIFCLFISFTSCEKQKYGNIVEKWHEPARIYTYLMPMRAGKVTMLIPYIIHDNEDWCIKVTATGTGGRITTKTYYVTPESYDTLIVGKFICVDGVYDEDNNNEKVRQQKS